MSVNLASLEPQQLVAFKQSTQQELVHLQSSYDALVLAQNKYRDCISSVRLIEQQQQQQHKDNAAGEMLIPLTSSLYVMGHNRVGKFKIDVGTGYFVEKDGPEAIAFFTKRVDKLSGDALKLRGLVADKMGLLQSIDSVLREKIASQTSSSASASKQAPAASS